MIITTVPLEIKPYKISLVANDIATRMPNIRAYVDDVLTLTLAQIASEIV